MIQWFVVHHTGAGPARPTVADVAAYQVSAGAHLPFPSFAYIMYVEEDGRLEVVWDLTTVCWSNGDGSPSVIQGVGIYNWKTVACCFSGENPTPEQVATIHRAHAELEAVLDRPIPVFGHRQITGAADSSCPGDLMIAELGQV